jgi:hypothetical protein
MFQNEGKPYFLNQYTCLWVVSCIDKILRVIQMTIFKNLEDIEGIRVSFLNLIYQNQSDRFLMDCLTRALPSP